jgi:hypothetical protein
MFNKLYSGGMYPNVPTRRPVGSDELPTSVSLVNPKSATYKYEHFMSFHSNENNKNRDRVSNRIQPFPGSFCLSIYLLALCHDEYIQALYAHGYIQDLWQNPKQSAHV